MKHEDYFALSDEQLFYLLKHQDSAAFTEIYKRYWKSLYRQAIWFLGDEDDAVDVVQDIFTSLWNNADGLVLISLRAYLYRITRNHILNLINKKKIRKLYLESLSVYMEAACSRTEEEIAFKECDERIKEEIANLPIKMKNIFEKSRYLGLSHRAIADELDVSEHTVKTTISRALKRLRTRLADITYQFIFFL